MRYFAYGSNMFFPRLQKLCPSTLFLGVAWLSGHTLKWHKRSKDGSGKCSLAQTQGSGETVYGALFAVAEKEVRRLEQAEGPGYQKVSVQVNTSTGPLSAETFVAKPESVDESLLPYTWYRDLVIAGAVQAELPEDYVNSLRGVQAEADPDAVREAKERLALPSDTGRRRARGKNTWKAFGTTLTTARCVGLRHSRKRSVGCGRSRSSAAQPQRSGLSLPPSAPGFGKASWKSRSFLASS